MRLLEVGCGNGALAAELGQRGLEVRALDHSSEAVSAARGRGVDAIEADFLGFEDERFDRVLFSRSLHHLHPLDQAVGQALRLLQSDGLLLVEDFAVEAPDSRTAQWFYGVGSLLGATGLSAEESSPLPHDPLRRWADEHHGHHPIATRQAMAVALGAEFRLLAEWFPPYLYRYFDQALAGPGAGDVIAAIRRWEQDLIMRDFLCAVGWRSVWTADS